MMHLLSWMSVETVRDLGWTLIHFLWQGVFLATVLEILLSVVRGAKARHNLALFTLMIMALAPFLTFLLIHSQDGGDILRETSIALHTGGTDLTIAINGTHPQGGYVAIPLFAPSAMPTLWIGWLVAFWSAGVAVLSGRALGGWYLADTLRRRDAFALPADLLERCHIIRQRLAVRRTVQFLQSLYVRVPTVVGWLRPVVLIPVSAIAGLAPQQLDALIMHELAHIQRHDALINIFLLVVETILFYQPAVWWVNRRIRIERENCCDDLAVLRCGDALMYVEALASLESGRFPPRLALAANGGKLRNRVARLLGVPSDNPQRYSLPAIAGAAIVSLVVGTVAIARPGTMVTNAIVRAVPVLGTQIAALFPTPSPVTNAIPVLGSPVVPISTGHAPILAEPIPPSNNKLVAVVDDTPISELNLEQRVQLVVALSSNKATVADMKRIRSDSLQLLEEEAVEREAAAKAHVTVSPLEIDRQIDDLLTRSKITHDQLSKKLADAGSSESSLRDQYVAALGWQKAAMLERVKDASDNNVPAQIAEVSPSMPSHSPILSLSSLAIPPYPPISRRLGEQGTTVLTLSVNKMGDVTEAVVANSSGKPRLDRAAVQWARANWRFVPATNAGTPVEGVATERVHWHLTDAF
jgi:TonB family protein